MRGIFDPFAVRDLGRNYVETTMANVGGRDLHPAGRRLVPAGFFAMISAGLERIVRMYRAVTRQIEVTVEPNFLPGRSSVERREYFWSYTIVITNAGKETVQLRKRHWIITDASGRQPEVRGDGVVGEQPVLAPGERFEYTCGVPLPTASGFMTGRYQMVSASGERFEIDVPTFSLDSPDSKRVLN
jgi:ApaG protein